MTLKLKYFGMVAETIGKSEEEVPFVETVNMLNVELKNKYSKLNTLNYTFAVNQTLVKESETLKENDEVALLPPFAGG